MFPARTSPAARYAVYATLSFFVLLAVIHILRVSEYASQLPDIQDFAQRTQAGLKHPISYLAQKSLTEFDAMLASQSNDLRTAIEEYRRRYHREPPPGFDLWFQYATKHGSLIIDEYDSIYDVLEPFWSVEPALLRKAVKTLMNRDTPNSNHVFGSIRFEGGEVYKNNTGWIQDGFLGLLKDVKHQLPDTEMLVSGADEPMLLRSSPDHGIDENGKIRRKKRPDLTWEDIQRPCTFPKHSPPAAPMWRTPEVPRGLLQGLPFVTNKYNELDICLHPEYDKMHDFGRSTGNEDFFVWDGLVPMFSQAAPSTYSDILYPTIQYWSKGQTPKYDYVSWADKKNGLFWKGSTTGGWALESNDFRHFLRHRFVEFVQGLAGPTYKLLKQSRLGYWSPSTTTELPADKYNVHFSAIIQCKPKHVCEEEQNYFEMGRYGRKNESAAYRFIMDIDGNTFANRFYRSLSYNSVVLKQTGFKEWHD